MPVTRKCSHCGKRYIASTYGMIQHVERCKVAESAEQLQKAEAKAPTPTEVTAGVCMKDGSL